MRLDRLLMTTNTEDTCYLDAILSAMALAWRMRHRGKRDVAVWEDSSHSWACIFACAILEVHQSSRCSVRGMTCSMSVGLILYLDQNSHF